MTQDAEKFRSFRSLQPCHTLETTPDSALNDLVQLAATLLKVSVAFVVASSQNTHRFKAHFGPLASQSPIDLPQFDSLQESGDILIIEDPHDLQLNGSRLLGKNQRAQFYAALPLRDDLGHSLGLFGVIDSARRKFSNEEHKTFLLLAGQALTHLNLARQIHECDFRQRILEGIFESDPECVKLLGPDATLQMVNPAGLRIIEADNIEQVGQNSLLTLVLPAYRAAVQAFIDRVFRGESGRITFEFQGLKGTLRWLEMHAGPLRDENKAIISLIGVTRDITKRIQAERARTDIENRNRALVQALGEVVYDWRPLSDELFWDGAFTKVLGYSGEEMGRDTESWTSRVHPEDLKMVLAEVEKARAENRHYNLEYRFRHRDGHYCWMLDRGVLSFDEDGQLSRIVGVVLDITERKNAEHALLQANERYSRQCAALTSLTRTRLLQGSDLQAALRQITEIAAETLGVHRVSVWTFNPSRTELVCADLFERPRQKHSHGQAIAASSCPVYFQALSTQDILPIEDAPKDPRTIELADGYLVPLQIVSMLDAPIRLDGILTGVLCNEQIGAARHWAPDEQSFAVSLASLVSLALAQAHHQSIEEQLRQAQKMEAIGQLAGGVAHDFNNILAAIMMQTELVASPELPEETREGLSEIRSAAERAANLTRQLLLFSRKQVMQAKDLDLNELVTSLTRMLQRIIGADVTLTLQLHPTPILARGDPGMLDQALLNLAVNARDAMPNGGELLIQTTSIEVTPELARLHPDAEPGWHVGFSVRDTGSGIHPDVLPRIFEPFFTTKEPGKGTGLGLATVFGIVKQHRGWINVLTDTGKGSEFQIFIPALAQSPAPVTASPLQKPRGGKETILIAEDDVSVRLLTRALLERNGYKTFEASTAEEAIHIWKRNSTSIHLLITDLVMPGGVTGLQLAQRLRQENPHLKVIFTSGYSAEIAGRELDLHPGENFVQKPSPPHLILTTVRRCLDG